MKDKVFITREIPSVATELLKENNIEVDTWTNLVPPTKEEIIQEGQKAQAIISMVSDPLDKFFFESCSHLKVISNFAVGVNNIDLKTASQKNIPIGNTPDVLTDATADLALCLLLALSRNLLPSIKNAKDGDWKRWEPLGFLGSALQGKNLGIIGMGRIGQSFAKKCHFGLGMNIVYHSRNDVPHVNEKYKIQKSSLEKTLRSDVVSVHCDLNSSTKHLMNRHTFSFMKEDAYFINTSRGEVIDQKALFEALKNNKIKGAGLDVTSPEPLPPTDELFDLENIIITPHIASATKEARDQMATIAAKNVILGLRGEKLLHSVTS